jgi:hypothetical protein
VTSSPTRDDVVKALETAIWTFAKTTPQTAYWYTLRQMWRHPVPFEAVVRYIRDHGVRRPFGGATYVYLDHAGWTYWTMGAPPQFTTLINRAKIAPG